MKRASFTLPLCAGLIAAPAVATELPSPTPPASTHDASKSSNWTGVYAGVNAGGSYGGQSGYDQQLSDHVVGGLEADAPSPSSRGGATK